MIIVIFLLQIIDYVTICTQVRLWMFTVKNFQNYIQKKRKEALISLGNTFPCRLLFVCYGLGDSVYISCRLVPTETTNKPI